MKRMRRWCAGGPQLGALAGRTSSLIIFTLSYSTSGKVKVRVKTRNGACLDVDAPVGITLREALRDVAQPGEFGSCNGNMECGACHVYLSEASFQKVSEPSEREEDLLAKSLDVRETSRLSCQVVLSEQLDGLEVDLPNYLGDTW
ncbi:adrenodoxin-like protein ferredoxin 2fe-2s-like protein [Leptomonas seymouri]|uniref:Adrenodoxin-like protein ferredoxin 2fe-2s-like protein n=1 Tax=Leptomonas seymouri TaxID=5684 RepID=A0A0N1PE81_LEPSE|nr:adrenodoxin-like protein ferredoxin 2fe-2s-like protein [Leptomonas seymouri]|eukprot:KPI88080.1 adrenodoxin-like protein ferredoxin 2fe-2s-like protein [Leptomonas seymouri]